MPPETSDSQTALTSRRVLPPEFGVKGKTFLLFDIVEQRKRNAGGACPGGFVMKQFL